MEYYELNLNLKIPRPRRSWFRYRVRTLLLLMLLTAIGATFWHYRAAGTRQRLLEQLQQLMAGRDAALQQWKSVAKAMRQGANAVVEEAATRAKYFKHRAEVECLLTQLSAESH
jgi:hypothetical protein